MQDELSIRLITPADSISELTHLLHRAYRPLAEAGMNYMACSQDDDETRRRIAKGECWLAMLNDRIVGTVTLYLPPGSGSPWYSRPDVASFGQFAVEPLHQSRGIGSRLVDHVERRAGEGGAAELACDTAEPAKHLIAWYERRGYRFVEFAQWKKANYRSVILTKSVVSLE